MSVLPPLIGVPLDGFPFVRTQVIIHLDRCTAPPPHTSSDQITKGAEDIARRLRT